MQTRPVQKLFPFARQRRRARPQIVVDERPRCWRHREQPMIFDGLRWQCAFSEDCPAALRVTQEFDAATV